MESTAKRFKNGRSQAVRLPRDFRLKGTEVKTHKEGEKVILEPVEITKWSDGFYDIFKPELGFEIPEPMPSKEFPLDLRRQTGFVSLRIIRKSSIGWKN